MLPGRPGSEGVRVGRGLRAGCRTTGSADTRPSLGVQLLPGAHLGCVVGVTHNASGQPLEALSCHSAQLHSADPCCSPRLALNYPPRKAGEDPASPQSASSKDPMPSLPHRPLHSSVEGRRESVLIQLGKGPPRRPEPLQPHLASCPRQSAGGPQPRRHRAPAGPLALPSGAAIQPFPTRPAPWLLMAP